MAKDVLYGRKTKPAADVKEVYIFLTRVESRL